MESAGLSRLRNKVGSTGAVVYSMPEKCRIHRWSALKNFAECVIFDKNNSKEALMARRRSRRKNKQLTPRQTLLLLLVFAAAAFLRWYFQPEPVTMENIPDYRGAAYVELNENQPGFSQEDLTTEAFELYSELDALGRCGPAYANICRELMPQEERGDIGSVKPTGWQTVKYDVVDGKYLYNRCHLIGYQLAGENANRQNLITGTRYLNVTGMLPFENEVDDYVDETGNHVLYRVTPYFIGSELVARGVQMEALSVEDEGDGVRFNVFVYNVQPGVVIDYATGESRLEE